jgi:hypothetical protein
MSRRLRVPTDPEKFDEPLNAFVKALHDTEFSEDEAVVVIKLMAHFAADMFVIIQQDLYEAVDGLGLAAAAQYAQEAQEDDWYKGFLAGVIASGQAVLHGREHAEQLVSKGIIPQFRKGMDMMLAQEDLAGPLAALVGMVKDGERVSPEAIKAAMDAWAHL